MNFFSMKSRFFARVLILVSVCLGFLAGCIPPDQEFVSPSILLVSDSQQNDDARLNAFLTLKDNQGPGMRLEVASIEVLSEDLWLPLNREPLIIDSAVIGTGQMLLGGVRVPPGLYSRLRMKVTKAEVQQAAGDYAVLAEEPFVVEMSLSSGLDVEPEDSRCLLLSWDVESSLQADNSFRLVLNAITPTRQLLLDLVFVSCPDINTVFVVRADKNWVVDSFGLPGRPTYLALDPDSSRQRLYVLASRSRTIKVVDLSSFRVVDFFPTALNDVPTFMTISPDGQSAYLLDERSGYLSRMDLFSGQTVARTLLGFRPTYVTFLPEQNLLAVSLSLSQRVLLLDPEDLAIVRTITTGNAPQGIVVSEGQIYIAENGSNTVTVSDLDARKSQGRLMVGFGPRRLLATDSQIYVSNYEDGSLSVLVPGQLSVIQEIFDLGHPLEMAFDLFYRRLYVADEEEAGLAVIDANANLLLKYISLGAKPFGMAVIQ